METSDFGEAEVIKGFNGWKGEAKEEYSVGRPENRKGEAGKRQTHTIRDSGSESRRRGVREQQVSKG